MKRHDPIAAEEAWLDKHQCAARRNCGVSDWWGLAKKSRILRAGRIDTAGRTFWLQSAVTKYLRSQEAVDDAAAKAEMAGAP